MMRDDKVPDLVRDREPLAGLFADAGFDGDDPFLAGFAANERAVKPIGGNLAYSRSEVPAELHKIGSWRLHELLREKAGELGWRVSLVTFGVISIPVLAQFVGRGRR